MCKGPAACSWGPSWGTVHVVEGVESGVPSRREIGEKAKAKAGSFYHTEQELDFFQKGVRSQ